MNPLVSIITPNYNSKKYILETIKSVQDQTYKNWELIIVDDASEDNSVSLIESFQKKDERILLIKSPKNEGAASSRNKGIEAAKGSFIAFLDSDDNWLSTKLEEQVNFMIQKKCKLSFTSYYVNSTEGKTINVRETVSYKNLLFDNYIGCLTAMYSVKELGKVYFPLIRKRQDWALWLKITKKGVKAYGIQQPLAIYNDRNNSISSNKFKLLKYNWFVYRKFEKLTFIKSSYYLVILILKKLLK